MKLSLRIISLGIAFLYLPNVFATPNIEGNWISLDEKTGKKRAVIHLFVENDELKGTIDKVYPEPGDTGMCSLCPGKFKDKPVLGLQIIWGLKEKSQNTWEGGNVLDAKTGKIYRAKMRLKSDKIYIRGYVGVSLLGRTQVWARESL